MTPKRLALALAAALCALTLNARAQTPSIEVSTDSFEAQFAVQGPARQMRVEIFSPSGELVFEADGAGGQSVRWPMTTAAGERAADGVYIAAITVTDPSGKRRKRVEQLTVSNTTANAPAPGPSPAGPVNGSGVAGKIAKWSSSIDLTSSIITESAGKIGVNVSPTATLQVSNPTAPSPVAANGTNATLLLQVSGGAGGDTTAVNNNKGGTGAGINLTAGKGGSAPFGSTNGKGGSITLQPGGSGTGAGLSGGSGNILLAPTGVGNVGIGTPTPASRLTVKSSTSANVLEVKDTGVVLISPTAAGFVGIGTTAPFVKLHVVGATTAASKNPVIGGDNTSSGIGVIGHSTSGDGVLGESGGGGNGVKGRSQSGPGVYGKSTSGIGVWGQSDTGKAGQFDGPVTIGGLLSASGCNGCNPTSDRGLKANFSSVNPRVILDRLARLPIQTWSYKSEPGVRHIGAMAQDFHAAFSFGVDDKTLSVVDAHGVTMAAIQGLYDQNRELASEVRQLRTQVTQQRSRLRQQQEQLDQMRRAIKRARPTGR